MSQEPKPNVTYEIRQLTRYDSDWTLIDTYQDYEAAREALDRYKRKYSCEWRLYRVTAENITGNIS